MQLIDASLQLCLQIYPQSLSIGACLPSNSRLPNTHTNMRTTSKPWPALYATDVVGSAFFASGERWTQGWRVSEHHNVGLGMRNSHRCTPPASSSFPQLNVTSERRGSLGTAPATQHSVYCVPPAFFTQLVPANSQSRCRVRPTSEPLAT